MPGSHQSRKTGSGTVRVGPAGWSYADWAGIVYPARKPAGFHEAAYLSEFFDTIEINTSFYQPLRPEHCRHWMELVSANPRFLFTAKLWQRFTHDTGAGPEDERAVRAGFDVLREAGKLGAVLLQFPFSFHRTEENIAYLSKLLKQFCRLSAGGGSAPRHVERQAFLRHAARARRGLLQHRSACDRPLDEAHRTRHRRASPTSACTAAVTTPGSATIPPAARGALQLPLHRNGTGTLGGAAFSKSPKAATPPSSSPTIILREKPSSTPCSLSTCSPAQK